MFATLGYPLDGLNTFLSVIDPSTVTSLGFYVGMAVNIIYMIGNFLYTNINGLGGGYNMAIALTLGLFSPIILPFFLLFYS